LGLSLVTAPAFDPLSLAEAKAQLRSTSDEEDGLIAGFILAARQYVEDETQKRLITQTLDYTIDDDWPCKLTRGYYRQRIEFPIGPVQSVTSVTYVDLNGAAQTLSTNDYVTGNMGTAVQSGVPYIEPAYSVIWPTPRCQSAAITVRFVAGWDLSSVPNPLMQAMRMLVAHADANREAVSNGTFNEVPLGVESYLSAYRDRRIL
jgi:uncharacterized phiE125 gp8 family phage protein